MRELAPIGRNLTELIVIAHRKGQWDECTYENLLPNPIRCPKPGFMLEVLIEILRTFYPTAKLQILGTDDWGSYNTPAADINNINRTSIFSVLSNGTADISSAIALSHGRANFWPTYVDPFIFGGTVMVFRKYSHSGPTLGVFNLLTDPHGLWFLLGTITIFKLLAQHFIPNNGPLRHEPFWQHKIQSKFSFLFSFFEGLILSALASYLLIVFTSENRGTGNAIPNFRRLKVLIGKNDFRLKIMAEGFRESLRIENAKTEIDRVFNEKLKDAEVVYDFPVEERNFRNEKSDDEPKSVIIGYTTDPYMINITAKCFMSFTPLNPTRDNAKRTPPATFYFQPWLKINMDGNKKSQILYYLNKVKRRYYPEDLAECRRIGLVDQNNILTLNTKQISGLLICFTISILSAIIYAVFELVIGRYGVRFRQFFKIRSLFNSLL